MRLQISAIVIKDAMFQGWCVKYKVKISLSAVGSITGGFPWTGLVMSSDSELM